MDSTNAETNSLDPRLLLLSHSSRNVLHTCPRKFQLYRLRAAQTSEEDSQQTVTFAFGATVGVGIQCVLQGFSEADTMLNMFLAWRAPLWAENKEKKKSFAFAVQAVQKFRALRSMGYMQGYELYYHDEVPAIEFSFRVLLPGGFQYRGHIDAVLRHTETGQIATFETKTTGAKWLHPAQYSNSSQAISYSIILDWLFPELSEYDVYYCPYKTLSQEYEPFTFHKSKLMRALWIRELMHDIENIRRYHESGVFPMYGENCLSFGRPCEYYGACTLSTRNLTTAYEPVRDDDNTVYTIETTLEALIQAQLGDAR